MAPPEWEVHRHPNRDIYFYHRELRLITPDDITDGDKLALVMESWDEHMQNMKYDPMGQTLADDWELILSDVTEESVVIEVISRNAGQAYKWSDDKGAFVISGGSPELISFPAAGLQLWEDNAHYWSILAEYPSHHLEIPPAIEAEFLKQVFSGMYTCKCLSLQCLLSL